MHFRCQWSTRPVRNADAEGDPKSPRRPHGEVQPGARPKQIRVASAILEGIAMRARKGTREGAAAKASARALSRPAGNPRSYPLAWGPALADLLLRRAVLPPQRAHQRRSVAGRNRAPGPEAKSGLHQVRDHRRGRAAQLERAADTGEPDWHAVAVTLTASSSKTERDIARICLVDDNHAQSALLLHKENLPLS